MVSSAQVRELVRRDHQESGLEELRRPIVRMLLLPLILVWWVEVAFVTDRSVGETWIGAGILTVLVAAVYLLEPSRLVAASVVLVAGLAAYAANVLFRYPDGFAPYLFPLIVFIASALLRPRFGVLVAVAASVALLAAEGRAGAIGTIDLIGALALTWTSTFVAWLIARPVHVALDWSWSHYVTALQRLEELRDQQGVLNRTLKELNDACYRLEQANAELARARRSADEARRLKAEFATNLSHELRAPLNLIVGFSEMIVTSPESYEGEQLPVAYRGDVEAIYRNACHLSALIDDVLDLGQIDADRMALYKEEVSLNEVVEEAVAITAGLFADKGLTVEVDLPPDLPTLFVDRTRIRQIFMNLLKNAVRFTDTGGVTITASVDGDNVAVAVSDTGIGIPPEELPSVFQEFRQLANAGSRRVGGSGLGLVISRKFAQMHGGDLTVDSAVERGSTFTLRLPLARDPVTTNLAEPSVTWVRIPTPLDQRRRVVAVVGDEESGVRLFQRHLDGYWVLPVSEPSRLPAIAKTTALDAVVVVDETPAACERLASELRHRVSDVPVVCCVLHGYQSARHELGVADYLPKPVTRQQLQRTLRNLGRSVRRLLVVDDDPEILRLLDRTIRSMSKRYQVWTVDDGAKALAMLPDIKPDAILLDLLMAGTDGYAVIDALRSDPRFRDLPVVVVTAKGRSSETVVAHSFSISQAEGLAVRDLMRCLRGCLDALRTPADSDSAPELRGVPVG